MAAAAPCIDAEKTISASHRPVLSMQAYLILNAIAMAGESGVDKEEPPPSPNAVRDASHTLAEVPFHLWGRPEISPFYGELHLTWAAGNKQVVLISFPDRRPLVHHYERVPNAASKHGAEDATGLAHWLGWLQS